MPKGSKLLKLSGGFWLLAAGGLPAHGSLEVGAEDE
jgi:hypothetical protein